MNQSKPVCVLLVENEGIAAERIQICLRQLKEMPLEVTRSAGTGELPKKTLDSRLQDLRFDVTWVTSLAAALQKITEIHFDILLLGLSLPDAPGLNAIRALKQAAHSALIVTLIDINELNIAQITLKAGAKDYIIKDDAGYEGMVRVIQYVLHRADIETRNQLLVAALEATSNAIIITNRDARTEWINPAFTQLTGYSFRETVGRRPGDLLSSGIHDSAFYANMWQKLIDGEHWQGEIINRHKDGSLYNADVGISPVFDKNGSLSGYVQIQRDITDSVVRLAIAEVLQQSSPLDERFKQILDVLFNLKSFDLQRKGGVFLRAKGESHLSLFVLRGAFSAEFIEKEQRVKCGSCLCGRVAVSGKILVSDDCFCDPRHEHQFTDMQAHGHYIVPIASDAEVLGVLFLYTDPYPQQSEARLTMLKQVGEMMALALRQEETKTALETARDLAMQASLVKSEFLANMSHEIRTPMNGVLGMLDLLRDTQMNATQLNWVETAYSSAEALLDIINDILDFSKLEAGKFEVEQVEFNLVNLVDDICALLAGRAHANGLELNCSLPVQMPCRWRGDPMRIRQVLTNLIGNAVKFTERGEVSVQVSHAQITDKGKTELRFEVRDSGIGIAPNMQTRLFQPFSQADSATSRRFGGSGLGLSISKKLVEVMGGSIGFDSVLGVGSCFWVTLPLASSEHPETAEQPYDLSGKRTLIVDDNATNRNILTAYLSGWGLAVSQADNGSAALMQLQTSVSQGTDYDLILLDMQMPIMDGLTVAKCLAHIPMLANIPIVLLSSGDQFDLADFQGTAIVQRLLKPVRQSQLFDAIVTALQCHTAVTVKPIKPKVPLPRYDGKRILVVEDNKINQKVIVAQLAKFNVVPDLADNGQLALDKLADNGYDLILMDCQMPVMDGYIATRELRLLEARKGLPRQTVIALTANALDGEREKCLAVGMDDYLTKPIITECLMDVLAYRLGHQHAPVPVPQNHSAAENNRGIWDEAAALKQVEGDDALLYEMIELFLLEAPKQLNELSAYQTEGNLLELANTAHAIKGTLGHFCADTAKDYTAILEHAARSGQSAPFQDMTAAVITSVTDLTARLMLAKNPNNPNK